MPQPDDKNRPANAFDAKDGYSGQDYHRDRAGAEGERLPSGSVGASPDIDRGNEPDQPPETGKRASFDPATGEVHGEGAGAGGNNPGEDYDSDPVGGDGTMPLHDE